MKSVLALVLIISLVSGCVGTKPNSTNTTNSTVTPVYPPVVDKAKNDLAEKLNTTPEQIQLVKQEKVDWPDTSLGYPEKGKMYAQVITPGFRIVLEAGGKLYEYHSDYERVVGPGEVAANT